MALPTVCHSGFLECKQQKTSSGELEQKTNWSGCDRVARPREGNPSMPDLRKARNWSSSGTYRSGISGHTFEGTSALTQCLRSSCGDSEGNPAPTPRPLLVVIDSGLNSPLDSKALKGRGLTLLIWVTPVFSIAVGQGGALMQVCRMRAPFLV